VCGQGINGLGQQPIGRCAGKVPVISQVRVHLRKALLDAFGLQVHPLRIIEASVKSVEQSHAQQRSQALSVGGQLPDLAVTITDAQRLLPLNAMALQVLHRQLAAMGCRMPYQSGAHLAIVQSRTIAFCNCFEATCQCGVSETFANRWCFPSRSKDLHEPWLITQSLRFTRPLGSYDLPNGKAMPRIINRRTK